jgi:hypothetical protein
VEDPAAKRAGDEPYDALIVGGEKEETVKRKTKLSIISALVGATSLVVAIFAQAGGGAPSAGQTASDVSRAAIFTYSGGQQKRVIKKIGDEPFTFGETTSFLELPGSAITVCVPAGTTDLLDVDFSAESRLNGAAYGSFDWLEIEVRRNGVPMEPHGPSGSPYAFDSSDLYESHAASFAVRAGGGCHTIRVFFKIVDNFDDNVLSAWIDDWNHQVHVSE